MKAAVAGVGPNMKGVVPCRRASSSQTSVVVGVKRSLGAEPQGQLEAGGAEVDGDDPFVAAVDQGGDGGEADRPTSEHGDALAGLDVGLVGGAHADGQRLRQGGHVERQIIGDAMEPAAVGVGHEEERREAAFGRAVADPAQLVVARLHDHPVADRGRWSRRIRPSRRRPPSRGRGTSGCRPDRRVRPS